MSLSTTLGGVWLGPDTHANRPATPLGGTLYVCTTHNKVEKYVSGAWGDWAVLVPAGGASGQVLTKNSSTDGDASWATPSGGSGFLGARVYNSANISVVSGGSGTILTFNSERYDTDNIHSTVSNTSRLTATTAGKYHISGTLFFANNTTGARGLQILLNGATNIAIVRIPTVAGTDVPALNISTVYDLAAGDYVELIAYQTSSGALNVTASGNQSPEFMMHRVG